MEGLKRLPFFVSRETFIFVNIRISILYYYKNKKGKGSIRLFSLKKKKDILFESST